jgi:DNA-binding SARP family transcriptional activator
MEFGLLGPLTVRHGDRLLAIPKGKPRAVLAALLVHSGRVVPADELIDLLWNGSPPPSARATLLNHVKRLRRALGGPTQARVRTSSPGYLVEAGPGELDLASFGELCAEGRRALRRGDWERAASHLTAALSLWRGQPLLDVHCPRLTVGEVPRLEQLRASALEDRIEADLHLGRHHEVITELQQLAASERLRERAHELLMLALYRAGRRADALAAYQVARRGLVSELGLEPGAGLRRLHQQVLAADPRLDLVPVPRPRAVTRARYGGGGGRAAAWDVVPRQLPPAGAALAGHQAERGMLTQLLRRGCGPTGTTRICVIGGSAGIGKTALAVHWAHGAATRFPGGQLYADLRGFGPHRPADPADVVRGFLSALGIPADGIPADAAAQAGLFRSLLASRRMLVLLDNAADAGQVRPLLPASPGSLVVITSRNQLAGLAAAEGAHVLTLAPLAPAQSQELLAHRLGPQRIASEPAAVAELIRLCGGLPLALAAAAARIASSPGLPIAAVTRALADGGSLLDALDTGDAATSVRPVFSWSCQRLSTPAAQLFQLIGTHGGQDISLLAAAGLARVSPDHARRLLAELTRVHLASEHAPGRFSVHPLLCAYAAERARVAPAREGGRPEPVRAA